MTDYKEIKTFDELIEIDIHSVISHNHSQIKYQAKSNHPKS